ncbi:structural protein [Cellulophaga phage phi39:1]|uniref:structural protein n=1 Tax=Cellulophaga phage phi39:1 TaxID=1327993 RepID=UPI000351E920|nr:structural protein [Cellulophaga phage phi39:1]AGO49132.1 structural protein [Cellulophaga phage phi39:1]
MDKIAIIINTILLASVDLQNLVNGKHYWELVPEDDKPPFITFSIIENTEATKDFSGDYEIRLTSYEKTLGDVSIIDSELKKTLVNFSDGVTRVKNLGAQSGYSDDETRSAVIIRNFNLKTRL